MTTPASTIDAPRWRPTPFLALSALLHVALAALVVVRPSAWPIALALLIADHVVITAIGLWPRSRGLGPNLVRLPAAAIARREIAITIDDGPDPAVTPRVLDILAAQDAKATFFCIGDRVRAHPELAREIVRRGHRIENHSQRHRHHFSFSGPAAFRREIDAAQRTIEEVTGARPTFFRAPAGLRNPFLDPVLAKLGLRLASWTRRGFDTATGDADRVFARLVRHLSAGDILLLHDGHAASTAAGEAVITQVLPRLLGQLKDRGLVPITLLDAHRP